MCIVQLSDTKEHLSISILLDHFYEKMETKYFLLEQKKKFAYYL